MRAAFIFETVWQLSLAEIIAYFKKENIEWTFVDLSKKAIVIDADFNASEAIFSLGGTLKIAEIKKDFDFKKIANVDFEGEENSPISFYGSHELFSAVKKIFKGITPSGVLSPKDLATKRKMRNENVMIFGMKKTYFGPTIAVQPHITKTDEQQPFKKEEMPSSRAMILINLSQAKEKIFVPNASTGSVGCGAAILGVQKIVLEEDDKSKLSKIKMNIEKYGDSKIRAERKINESGFTSAACVLPKGPEIHERVPKKDAEDLLKYARKEQKKTFDNVINKCKDGATFACIFPVFNSYKGKVFANKYFEGVRMKDPFEKIPEEYKEYLKIKRKMLVDEEPGRKYDSLREFCVYEIKK